MRYLVILAASVLSLVGCASTSIPESPATTSEVAEPADEESALVPTAEDCAIYDQAWDELVDVLANPEVSDDEFKSGLYAFERAMPAPFESLGEMMTKSGEAALSDEETTGQEEEAVRLRELMAVADDQCAEFK